uniref:Uncharacterized protein n=1 Tax=Romanomermis culicivorax TaxID=13658 RepID=A0A915KKT8_ROMCU
MEFVNAFSIHLLENIHKSYDRNNFFALIDNRFDNIMFTKFSQKLNKKNKRTTALRFVPKSCFLSDLLDFDAVLKEKLNKQEQSATVRAEKTGEKGKSVENVNACSLSTIQSVEMEISINCDSDQNDQMIDSYAINSDIDSDDHESTVDPTDFNNQDKNFSTNRDFDRGDQLPEINYNDFDKRVDENVMLISLDYGHKSCQIVNLEMKKLDIENKENEDQNQSINNESYQANNSNTFEKSNDSRIKRLSLGSPTPPISETNSPMRTSPYNLRRKSLSLDRKTTMSGRSAIKSPKENRSSVLRRKASSGKICL